MEQNAPICPGKFPITQKMPFNQEQLSDDENCTGTSNWTLNTGNENCTGTSNWTLNGISRASTVCCGGNGNGNDQSDNDLIELKLKMATMEMEMKNQMFEFETKLEYLKLVAENRALKEENNTKENKAIRAKMETTEKLENTIQEIRQEMQMGIQRNVKVEKNLKEKAEERYATFRRRTFSRRRTFQKCTSEAKCPDLEEETQQQSKNLITPLGNRWIMLKKMATISPDGLKVTRNASGLQSVSAEKGFQISADFSGPVLYYYEVTNISTSYNWQFVGLSNGNIPDHSCPYVVYSTNSYGIRYGCNYCHLSRNEHPFEWPNHATKPKWNRYGDVVGCGLVPNPEKKVSIFFTLNGILIGKQIPINPTVDTLYPTVTLYGSASLEANFGDDSAKPFRYDIKKCMGLNFEYNLE